MKNCNFIALYILEKEYNERDKLSLANSIKHIRGNIQSHLWRCHEERWLLKFLEIRYCGLFGRCSL